MSSSPIPEAIVLSIEEQALNQKKVLIMASKSIEILEPNMLLGHPLPPRNPTDLWAKAKRNITIRRKISQHFLPRSVSFYFTFSNTPISKKKKDKSLPIPLYTQREGAHRALQGSDLAPFLKIGVKVE